jgi:hypothetical protein
LPSDQAKIEEWERKRDEEIAQIDAAGDENNSSVKGSFAR